MECCFGVGSGQNPGYKTEQNNAEGMGDGHDCPEEQAVPGPPPCTYHIGGDQSFSVTGLKSMQCTESNSS